MSGQAKSKFEELLGELDVLAKALPPGDEEEDEEIEAASGNAEKEEAGEKTNDQVARVKANSKKKPLAKAQAMSNADSGSGGDGGAGGTDTGEAFDHVEHLDGVGSELDGKKRKRKSGPAHMAKSFTLVLEDGTEVQAEDGTELIKSLTVTVETLGTKLDGTQSALEQTLEQVIPLLKAQSAQISALQGQIKAMGGEGRGRKTVLTVTEKPAPGAELAKGMGGEGLKPQEFLAKASSKFNEGKLSGNDLCVAEACVNRGVQVPEHIIRQVSAA